MAIFATPPTASITYASVGYGHNGNQNPVVDSNLTITYDAASNTYLAGFGPSLSRVDKVGADSSRFLSTTIGAIYRPGPDNPELKLTYTSLVATPLPDPWSYAGGSFVAFGRPTPVGAVPITGTATYNGVAYGQSLSTLYNVGGTVRLNFDFAAGALSGYFDPLLIDQGGGAVSLARQTFADTLFVRGGQTFSGTFAGLSGSSFNGQFTGPAAEEFMARFRQPLNLPGAAPRHIVGVWVGNRVAVSCL